MSDHDHEADKSAAERTLDFLLYAPVGAIVSAIEEFPEMANKGRARVEVHLNNARLIGKFVVTSGGKDIERRLRDLRGNSWPSEGATDEEGGEDEPQPSATITPMKAGGSESEVAHKQPTPTERYDNPAVDRALPGYDTLSASQVVRRLDGLGPDELQAVYHHEAATRGRRTILHRTQQLLGTEDPPGTSASSPV